MRGGCVYELGLLEGALEATDPMGYLELLQASASRGATAFSLARSVLNRTANKIRTIKHDIRALCERRRCLP